MDIANRKIFYHLFNIETRSLTMENDEKNVYTKFPLSISLSLQIMRRYIKNLITFYQLIELSIDSDHPCGQSIIVRDIIATVE